MPQESVKPQISRKEAFEGCFHAISHCLLPHLTEIQGVDQYWIWILQESALKYINIFILRTILRDLL